jgi:hypothetical protein
MFEIPISAIPARLNFTYDYDNNNIEVVFGRKYTPDWSPRY